MTQIKQKDNGLVRVELGEIAEFKRGPFGSSIKKSVCVPKSKNTYKLYEQGNVINLDFSRGNYYLTQDKFNELKHFEVMPQDILVTCAGTLGKIAIVPEGVEKGIINSVLMRIRLKRDIINEKYFLYFFGSSAVQNDIQSKSAGVAVKNLFATRLLKKFEIPLPPLPEQTLIVQEIEKQFTKLDAAVKYLTAVKEKLEIYRKAVLKEAFEGNYPLRELKDFCKKISDGSHNPPEKRETGEMMLSAKNIMDDSINFDNPRFVSKEEFIQENKRTELEIGDVLLTIVGTIGRTAIVKKDYPKFVLQRSVCVLKPNDKIDSRFLSYYLRSSEIQHFLIKNARGVAQLGVYLNSVRKIPVIKISKEEQQQIVQEIESKFSVIDKIEQVVEASLEKTEKLRKSILKSAFEGKLVKMEE